MNYKINFETRNKDVGGVKDTLKYIARTSHSSTECFVRMRDILPSSIIMGSGGAHMWAVNSQNNKRLFIVYF